MSSPVHFRLGQLSFTWDRAKAEANAAKHGITFEEAATTWLDPFALERFDEEHSDAEDRWLRIASSLRGPLLVVWSADAETEGQIVIRIIGAWRASRRERDWYEKQGKIR
ncbi:MAG: BrnT family toxin [Armatimonadetes bacterium]|nr:BrnT family toxin [Armatimonadota bacterium]